MNTPGQICPRCFSGIDDNGDGDCGNCARLTDLEVLPIVQSRCRMYLDKLFESEALNEELKRWVQIYNPDGNG